MAAQSPTLCVVSPCYQEAEVIEAFYRELKEVLVSLPELSHRIVLVDDGSSDETLVLLNGLAAKDPAVRVYSLSRNFGHQAALTAGLDAARGDAVVLMDSDLQHPPYMIREMIRLWKAGNDVVSAVRRGTANAGRLKSSTSRGFYWLINLLSDTPIVSGAADFCLLSRRAHRALLRLPERHRFLRGMVSWIGYQRAYVHFDAPERRAGHSKYTALKMVALALNATFSFSAAPIRLATQLGLLTVLLSLLYLIFILACLVFKLTLVQGWASIIFVVTFLGGVQLVFLGVLGEYVARIFEEVKARPMYLLKQQPPPEAGGENLADHHAQP